MTFSLLDIRKKVRNVTGRTSPEEFSDSLIDDYINKYYVFTFPAEVRLQEKKVIYEFLTKKNINTYDFDETNYLNVQSPPKINNLNLEYSQNPIIFLQRNQNKVIINQLWTGDGFTTNFTFRGSTAASTVFVISNVTQATQAVVTTATPHTFSVGDEASFSEIVGMTELNGNTYNVTNIGSSTTFTININSSAFASYVSGGTVTLSSSASLKAPILQSTLIITDDAEVFEDKTTTWTDSDINLTGSLNGTAAINLDTGDLDVTFNSAPKAGAIIRVSYVSFTTARPHSVLYFNNKFVFFSCSGHCISHKNTSLCCRSCFNKLRSKPGKSSVGAFDCLWRVRRYTC